jgi:hypothetical protein
VIGAQFMAATRAHAQAAAVSGNQPQAVPAHRIDMGLGQRNQAGAGQLEQFGRQPPPRLPSAPNSASSSVCTLAHMPDIISAAMRGNVSVRLRVKAVGERRTRSASTGSSRKSENSARNREDAGI